VLKNGNLKEKRCKIPRLSAFTFK